MSTVDSEFIKAIDTIIKAVTTNGSLLISGTGGSGKTYASMWIYRQIRASKKHETQGYKTLVLEPCINYRYKFDACPYIELVTTKVLPIEADLIVDMNSMMPSQKRMRLIEILSGDFLLKQQLKITHNGLNPYENFYILDELHNMVGRYSLVSKNGENLLDVITEGRNVGMYFIGVTRRLSDLSTQFVESSRTFLFGKTVGDNDLSKIRKMYGKKVADEVADLKPRSFIFYDTENSQISEIGFPDFVQEGKPYQLEQNRANGYVRYISN